MREFSTAAKTAQPLMEGAEPTTIRLDGEEIVAYPPSAGQLALVMSAMAEGRDVSDSVAAVIDFFDSILDADGRALLRRRLFDRDDPFDLDTIEEILEGLMEEWTARPTSSPSASSSSRSSGGSRSTAKRPSKGRPA